MSSQHSNITIWPIILFYPLIFSQVFAVSSEGAQSDAEKAARPAATEILGRFVVVWTHSSHRSGEEGIPWPQTERSCRYCASMPKKKKNSSSSPFPRPKKEVPDSVTRKRDDTYHWTPCLPVLMS